MSARSPVVLVTAVGAAAGARGAAAALACAGGDADAAALLVDVGGRPPRPTLLASAAARGLEERLAAHLPRARIAARGALCQLAAPADEDGLELASAATTVARGKAVVVLVEPGFLQALLAAGVAPRPTAVLLRADPGAERPLLTLLARDLVERGLAVAVLKQPLAWVAERRALFGALPADGAGGLPASTVGRLLLGNRQPGAQTAEPASEARSSLVA